MAGTHGGGGAVPSLLRIRWDSVAGQLCYSLVRTETPLMTITVRVPFALRTYTGGASELTLEATDVRTALERLEREHPRLYVNVCDETGAVRRHVNVFVNSDNVRDGKGLDTSLAPGDVLTILPAVSGG